MADEIESFGRDHLRVTRRHFLGAGVALSTLSAAGAEPTLPSELASVIAKLEPYFTLPKDFQDVSRGKPLPHSLPDDKKKEVGIPIVKLNRGEQINIRFEVQKGIGKMHSRWAPTEIATFQPDP